MGQSVSHQQTVASPGIRVATALFAAGAGLIVLYLVEYALDLRAENDFYREAWPAYRLLLHGHFLGFLRDSPAYVGSLLMRAPFALLAGALGASARGVYVATAIPCVLALALLAGYLAARWPVVNPGNADPQATRGIRPLELLMFAPPVLLAINSGHPEDLLGGTLCVLAVLMACRGSGWGAGLAIALAVINKAWALVAAPLVFALMPADRRLSGFLTAALASAALIVPLTALRISSLSSASSALGVHIGGIVLIPQLLWWLPRGSWIVLRAHILLVLVCWLVTCLWWWLRVHRDGHRVRADQALAALILVLFLRAALDPWDDTYYLTPFLIAVAAYDERPGAPWLTVLFTAAITVIVPPSGLLHGLGANGEAACFAAFALGTIAWFARRAFRVGHGRGPVAYRSAAGSRA